MNDEHPNTQAPQAEDEMLLKELREHAAQMELKAVDFLDRRGKIAGDRRTYMTIRMTFIDGRVITLPRRLEPHLKSQQFKLRSTRDDA